MKAHDAFPSQYLKAADLDGKEMELTIRAVKIETIGDDERPIVSFVETEQKLVLNKTNFGTIEEVTKEDDSDNWGGKKIVLIPKKTEFQGKRVPCIRIKDDLPF